jgi:hypothetical protein
MPIPTPNPSEKQADFIKRCYVGIKDEYKKAQAMAICYNTWKNKQ